MNDNPTIEDVIEGAAQAMRDAAEDRKWLKVILPILQLSITAEVLHPDVQTSLNRMMSAAAERVARILRGDIIDAQRSGNL